MTVTKGIVEEQRRFEVAWRTIDGLKVRYATNGRGGEKVVLFSPWPESIFAFAPVWGGLTKQFEVLAIDLPGFGRSEARDDLFAPQKMGEFIAKAIDAFGLTSVHAVGLDVGSPSVLFAALTRPELFRSLIVGAGASTYPLVVEGALKSMIEAEALPPLNAVEVVGRFLGSIRGYAVPPFVRDDYLASYEGDRLTRSAALVRAYPNDLAALAPRLASIKVPVAIVVGRNDPYGLARDAALLRERLPHARLDVLEAGHCVWEERAPEFESIVTQWVNGGFRGETMSSTKTPSNTTAPTQFLQVNGHSYAYRRFGNGSGLPLLCLQHFTGTLDNWDPAVTDPLASGREVILFDNAGVGRSTGDVPETIAGMAEHPMAFLDKLGIKTCDVIGYSLGGMVALQMVQDRPSIFRRMILVGTAPRGGEDIMHLEKPSLAKRIQDPTNRGYDVLKKIFFTSSPASQAAGEAFIRRISQRKDDLDPVSGPKVASAQIAAFREWEGFKGQRFAELRAIRHPTLVVNGVHDEMIPVSNSYRLSENLANAVLLTYPDAGHGSLFQYPESFTRHAAAFLSSDSESGAF